MLCKARVEVPKMQRQTVVVTQVSKVKALKTKGPETVRTQPRVRFPEVCPVVQTVNRKSMLCKARVEVPKMQRQTVVVTRLSQVKALKTKGREKVRTPPRVKFPERRSPVMRPCKARVKSPKNARTNIGCDAVIPGESPKT